MDDIYDTEKFRDHLKKKLSKRDLFEDFVDEIVGICTEVSEKLSFLSHTNMSARYYQM